MDGLHPAGLNGRYQRRMRVQRPVPRNAALQPQRFAIGRQQQLDGRRVEADAMVQALDLVLGVEDRKSTRLNSSHSQISYAVFCLKKKKKKYAKSPHMCRFT